ncbi:MAG: response regulator [Thermodesulfobacteriota bacterium]
MFFNLEESVSGDGCQPGLVSKVKQGGVRIPQVLSIEGEPDIRKLLSLSLNYKGRYEVITAENGTVGLEEAKKRKFDCILMDSLMPVMDGYQTCKRLKRNSQTKDIPVIFLTAQTQQKEIEKGMALGAVDYLLKPFDPMKLPDQIEQILARVGKGSD